MNTFSQTALLTALRDIQTGVEYPDFWDGRYGYDESEDEEEEQQ